MCYYGEWLSDIDLYLIATLHNNTWLDLANVLYGHQHATAIAIALVAGQLM